MATTKPTPRKRKNMIAWGIGFFSCQAGASLLFLYGGMWLVKVIEPAVRGWHMFFVQLPIYGLIMALTLIIGWVIPRNTICKIPWVAQNF